MERDQTMDLFEKFLQDYRLDDPDDIDALLEFASLVRELVDGKRYSEINRVITYTIEHDCYEAFVWAVGILQEDLEREDGALEDFVCVIGKSIPDYNEFIRRLQVDLNIWKNEVEKVRDSSGEVQSFFNIFTYKTGFRNIYLVSTENFDTRDNDYINYKLSFVKDTDVYNS